MGYSTDSDPFHQNESPSKKIRRKKKDKNEDTSFMNKNVDLVDSILFPEGYENIMLAVYFLTVPYIVGLLFIFFYIGKGDTDIFLSLNDQHSFFITWAIGYEIVAAIILLWIVKLGFSSMSSAQNKNNGFRIP